MKWQLLIVAVMALRGTLALAEAWPMEDEEWQYRRPDAIMMPKPEEGDASPSRKRPQKRKKTLKSEPYRPQTQQKQSGEPPTMAEDNNTPLPPSDWQPSSPWDSAPTARPRSRPNQEEMPPTEAETPREVANVPPATSEESAGSGTPMPPPKANFVRMGLTAGLSAVSSGSDSTQRARQEQALTQNFLVGVMADGRLAQYFGAELDAYYGLAPTITLAETSGNERTKAVQHSGALFNLKAQIPLGDFLSFKVGLGFGTMSINHDESVSGTATVTTQSASGPLATGGIELNASPELTFLLDYARTVGGSGTLSSSTSGGTATETELTDPALSRFRLGATYRFTPTFLGGLIFNFRGMSAASVGPPTGTTPSGNESFSQFTVVGLLEL